MERCLGCMEICGDVNQCPSCGYTKGTPPKEIYHLTPGTILYGKYIVGRVLGYGGFGVTYIGWDNILERKVAIKEFLPGDFSTRMPGHTHITVYDGEATEQFISGLERFTDEAKRLAKFNGIPGIVGIYDTFTENNTGYIVMELLEGKTVKEILRDAGVLPYEKANEIIMAVLTVLERVHQSGIIHRDISPDNIFITNAGEIKVIDFGAARYATTSHSKSLSVILKPGYAPEEQYRSHGNQGPWSDVYAVAATYYKFITGVTIPEAMERVAQDKIKLPSALGAVLPLSAENAIMNALIVDAEQRTRSCGDFLRDLQSESVERIAEKRAKIESGQVPLWLKISAGVVSLIMVTLISLAAFGVINIFGEKLTLSSFFSSDSQVPNIINLTEDEAHATIEAAALTMTITGKEYNENIEQGRVLSQTPTSGSLLQTYGVVEVLMSGGIEDKPQAGKMPYVMYSSEADARQALETLGVKVNITYEQSETVAKGIVMTQSIEADAELPENAEVTLVVSSGPPPTMKTPKPQKTPKTTNNKPAPVTTPKPATPAPATPKPAAPAPVPKPAAPAPAPAVTPPPAVGVGGVGGL